MNQGKKFEGDHLCDSLKIEAGEEKLKQIVCYRSGGDTRGLDL